MSTAAEVVAWTAKEMRVAGELSQKEAAASGAYAGKQTGRATPPPNYTFQRTCATLGRWA